MDVRNRLTKLEQGLEARESHRGYTMVVARPAGGRGDPRPSGVYADTDHSVTVIFEGSNPDEKVMSDLASKMSPEGVTIICEPDIDHQKPTHKHNEIQLPNGQECERILQTMENFTAWKLVDDVKSNRS